MKPNKDMFNYGKSHLSIAESWCENCLVTYPVSYRYNGGIIIKGEWYQGIHVERPEVPQGFKLISIGCGLQLNATPPYATNYLKPLDTKKISRKKMKTILSNMS